jgi:hypothetical protein
VPANDQLHANKAVVRRFLEELVGSLDDRKLLSVDASNPRIVPTVNLAWQWRSDPHGRITQQLHGDGIELQSSSMTRCPFDELERQVAEVAFRRRRSVRPSG